MKVPKILLDNEGYPTNEFLDFIRKYRGEIPIKDFLEILRDGWFFQDWGFVLKRKYKGKKKLELHTGGWSGNEETIREIIANPYIAIYQMRYIKWVAGGHYYFEIKY